MYLGRRSYGDPPSSVTTFAVTTPLSPVGFAVGAQRVVEPGSLSAWQGPPGDHLAELWFLRQGNAHMDVICVLAAPTGGLDRVAAGDRPRC